MSDQNFLRYFANLGPDEESRSLNTVDIGLLRVADGTNVEQLTKVLRDRLPKDISVYTKQEFVDQELNYWRKNTSIGFVFSLLTTMSFLVGVILVYQILYTDVADHWVEYATLKAIGYSNRYLFGVVLQQATLLGFLGFVPGCLISFGLYTLTRNATGLYMVMTPSRILNLMIATFLMCLISGVIAVRRVQQADPAEVFGS
jgi:putative ABC transport system permease protein